MAAPHCTRGQQRAQGYGAQSAGWGRGWVAQSPGGIQAFLYEGHSPGQASGLLPQTTQCPESGGDAGWSPRHWIDHLEMNQRREKTGSVSVKKEPQKGPTVSWQTLSLDQVSLRPEWEALVPRGWGRRCRRGPRGRPKASSWSSAGPHQGLYPNEMLRYRPWGPPHPHFLAFHPQRRIRVAGMQTNCFGSTFCLPNKDLKNQKG